MTTLDLGCGSDKQKGAFGVDRAPLEGVDLVTDLEQLPYPFAESSFDAIYLNDVIEHLPNTIKVMEEVYRIARPNAHVYIRVIPWNSHYNAMDPSHVRTFCEHTFSFFSTYKHRLYYTHARFDLVSLQTDYAIGVQRLIRSKRILRFLGTYLNNIIEGLRFDLQTRKPSPPISGAMNDEVDVITTHLRCPGCLNTTNRPSESNGRLSVYDERWFICTFCNRKYPFADGLPFISTSEGDKWRAIETTALPKKLPIVYKRFIVET